MTPAALIFDFNGVLVDDEHVHFELFQALLAERSLPLTSETYFARYFVYDDAGVFRAFFADAGKPLAEAEVLDLCRRKAEAYARLPQDRFRYFEGSEALARDAAARVPVAIASGARGDEIRRHLQLRNLASVFRAVVAIEDVSRGKPDPEPYLEAARRLGVSPGACVAVEDSPGGVASARAAGMKVVGVTHSVPRERMPADLVLDSLAGLTWPALLERLSGR